jgi:hypothetical protein
MQHGHLSSSHCDFHSVQAAAKLLSQVCAVFHAELTVILVIDVRAGIHTKSSASCCACAYLREIAEEGGEGHSDDVPAASCSRPSNEGSTHRSNTVSAFEGSIWHM